MNPDLIAVLGGPDGPILSTPIEQHLEALATERDLPEQAVIVCLIRLDEAAPAIRAVLAKAADGETFDDAEDTLLFRGLHILGAGRDAAAWPLLVRFLRRPEDELDDRLGDAVTETLSGIAAGLFDGDSASLFDLVLDTGIDDLVRDALLRTATFLTVDGRIDRSDMEALLRRFWEHAPGEYHHAWTAWLEAVALLGFDDLVPLVDEAFDRKLINEYVFSRVEFEEDLAKGAVSPEDEKRLEASNLGYLEDVLSALRRFSTDDGDDLPFDVAGLDDGADEAFDPRATPQEPVHNPWRHVGRNDPCPCGSGKKAKKCCLATG